MLTRKKNGFKIKKELASEGYDAVIQNVFPSDFVFNTRESNVYPEAFSISNTLYDSKSIKISEDTITEENQTSPLSISDTSVSDINDENQNVILANETIEQPHIEKDIFSFKALIDLSDHQYDDLVISGSSDYFHGSISDKDTDVILVQSFLAMDLMPCYLLRISLLDPAVLYYSVIEKEFQITHSKIERIPNNNSYLVERNGTKGRTNINYPSLKEALENLKPTNQAFPIPSSISIFRKLNGDKFEQWNY
jgi:hypothetical protein